MQKPPNEPRLPHELDGIEARGAWIICEHVGSRKTTASGLHVPEVAQIMVWVVLSCGPDQHVVKTGERVIFATAGIRPPEGGIEVDGRRFMLLRPESIVAVLPMPKDTPLIAIAGALGAVRPS